MYDTANCSKIVRFFLLHGRGAAGWRRCVQPSAERQPSASAEGGFRGGLDDSIGSGKDGRTAKLVGEEIGVGLTGESMNEIRVR